MSPQTGAMRQIAGCVRAMVLLGALAASAAGTQATEASAPGNPPPPSGSPELAGQVFVNGGWPLFWALEGASPFFALGIEAELGVGRYLSLYGAARGKADRFDEVGLADMYVPVQFAPGFRVYPLGQQALTGPWLGLHAWLAQVEFVSDGRVSPSPGLLPVLSAGYTLALWDHLALSAGVDAEVFMGVFLVPRLAAGYRF